MPASDNQYDKFLESIEPFSVSLNSCSTSIDRYVNWQARKKELRPVSHISANYEVDWVGEKAFDIIGKMKVTTEHPETNERILNIECAFEAHFHGGSAAIRKEYVSRFAQAEVRVFIWPYFRQFVTDITSKMGIAPLMIPITVREEDSPSSKRARKARPSES
jgi:preprotein translocase subunit SecB